MIARDLLQKQKILPDPIFINRISRILASEVCKGRNSTIIVILEGNFKPKALKFEALKCAKNTFSHHYIVYVIRSRGGQDEIPTLGK